MKTYTGKSVESILEKIAAEQNVDVNEITYKVISQSGFSFFAKAEIEAYTNNDIIDSIKKYINDSLTAMGFEVKEIIIEFDEKDYKVSLDTDNNGLVIGINGKNLYALETLTRQVMSNIYKKKFFITLDVNHYFDEKEEKLKRFAYKIAAEVGRTKIDAKLDPMPNYDRKVIHKVLKTVHYVNTKSYGEGKNRHLIVHYDRENDIKFNEAKNNK
ncbi:protein jag [Mycoplasma sp. P36-A1]|uniref:Jag family protein n=1 Tax=Mycoplasma sp. P36-A1 TaxID=3252900 RepID=UPI003C2FC424